MISVNEQQPLFNLVNQKIHQQSSELIERLKASDVKLNRLSTAEVQNEGIWPDRFYYLVDGNICMEYDDKELMIFEPGDIIFHPKLDDIEETGIYYSVKSEVCLEMIELTTLIEVLSGQEDLISSLFSLLSLNQFQANQMIGVLTQKEERANPGFGRYKAGMAIINEGDDADYVYSISEGTAVAVHNGVEVGDIKQDEIFGAIAVLTNQKRTASVLAKTNCTVLMVHKDEFSKMLHSHPKLFLNILKSLSEKIVSLNKKISG
jgi:CRP/FNR family transcriptional regulator, cyclic AMP receptor protein